ncbi:hypothetical protein LROSL1_0882 [Furfurilactobacillus rossiae]|uniref:hypothetical protein n=1 Tax=Furfurilactobacillus rossiae TaxID=231049 RepID=UPI0015B9B42F|nr:hypothetical protein [Furfurilactobacillus rossiae]MCF6165341.1 hypothetical protein [Furfurilactobacillus rossiae]QLE63701.1 hypothetical protein LROSL1_0882 [Furfurilactobacillus rossiae]
MKKTKILLGLATFTLITITTPLTENGNNIFGTPRIEAKKTSIAKRYEKAINEDIQSDDYGNMKFSWNKKDQSYEATLDPNSRMYQAMDSGEVSIWNAFVGDIKIESKTIKKYTPKYDAFQIINPDDTSKVLLQVYDGKVRYNVGDDLQ